MSKEKDFFKYYKGEDVCPYKRYPQAFFWTAEMAYSNRMSEDDFNSLSSFYMNVGGELIDGIPYGLLISMFALWAKGEYDIAANIGAFHTLAKRW